MILAGSRLEANAAQYSGGGLTNSEPGTLTLTNSTVEANSAQSRGGGINNTGFDLNGTHYSATLA